MRFEDLSDLGRFPILEREDLRALGPPDLLPAACLWTHSTALARYSPPERV